MPIAANFSNNVSLVHQTKGNPADAQGSFVNNFLWFDKNIKMDQKELAYQKELVYRASMEFIKIKGLEEFIEYLQLVDETDRVPSGNPLDKETYVAVLRQAINDYRKNMLK
jgi:hypothetical protein